MANQPQGDDEPGTGSSTELTPLPSYKRWHPSIRKEDRFNSYDLDGIERSFAISQPVEKRLVWDANEASGRLDEMMVGLNDGCWVLLYDPPGLTEDPSTQITPSNREVTGEEARYWIENVGLSEPAPRLQEFNPLTTDANYPRLHRDWQPPSASEFPPAAQEASEVAATKAPSPEAENEIPEAASTSTPPRRENQAPTPPQDSVNTTVILLGKAARQIDLVQFLAPRENRSAELRTVAKEVFKRRFPEDKKTIRSVRRQVERTRDNLADNDCPLRLRISGNAVRLIEADPVA
jgi:hypothetical protein